MVDVTLRTQVGPPVVCTFGFEPVPGLGPLADDAGVTRLRLHVRGRDPAWEAPIGDGRLREEHWILAWAGDAAPPRVWKDTDRFGSAMVGRTAPELDSCAGRAHAAAGAGSSVLSVESMARCSGSTAKANHVSTMGTAGIREPGLAAR